LNGRWLASAGAALHFVLIFIVCSRDLCDTIATDGTLPSPIVSVAGITTSSCEVLLLENAPASQPPRQLLLGYLNLAGIESGYGFFGPQVPRSYQLAFELHYSDGRIQMEELHDVAPGMTLRLDSLLGILRLNDDATVRDGIIKMLAENVWRRHDDLAAMRATLQLVDTPTMEEYSYGGRVSLQTIVSYDLKPTR
jgi:hypothetical protein